jgi:thiol:disulfide interchange protein DsbG
MTKFSLLFFFALGLIVNPAMAQEAPPVPAPIQALEQDGAVVKYLGQEQGLQGWVTFKDGQEQYFYVTPDGQSIVMGILFNNRGDAVTLRQVAQLREREGAAIDKLAGVSKSVPQTVSQSANAPAKSTSSSRAEQFFADVQKAAFLKLGDDSAPKLYSFIDPQCTHCHDLINDVRQSGLLQDKKIQLRLIPVGLMNETSLREAANMLSGKITAQDVFAHIDGNKNALLKDQNPNTQAVQKNMALMQEWKMDVTPFSVYRAANGEVKILRGTPEDIKTLVADAR